VSARSRILAYGTAAALVLAGALVAILISGTTAQVLTFVLIALGLVLATSLVFLEVGLSEDRELARERKRRARAAAVDEFRRQDRKPPSHERSHRRRLR
jgi:hypothetical protein